MAYKRLLFGISALTICYLTGVTWANVDAVNKDTHLSSNISNATQSSIAKDVLLHDSSNSKLEIKKINNDSKNSTRNCVCTGLLLPRLENGKEVVICPECKCKFEARNTTLIKVVVIIVIWIISVLVIYMLFLMCLDPLLNKRVKANYQEHTNEDDETAATPPLPNSGNQEMNARANVLNRVGHQTNKWKRQVLEQRRRIYDRHTMLN